MKIDFRLYSTRFPVYFPSRAVSAKLKPNIYPVLSSLAFLHKSRVAGNKVMQCPQETLTGFAYKQVVHFERPNWALLSAQITLCCRENPSVRRTVKGSQVQSSKAETLHARGSAYTVLSTPPLFHVICLRNGKHTPREVIFSASVRIYQLSCDAGARCCKYGFFDNPKTCRWPVAERLGSVTADLPSSPMRRRQSVNVCFLPASPIRTKYPFIYRSVLFMSLLSFAPSLSLS